MNQNNRPTDFICLWEYKAKKSKDSLEKCWKLVECYGVDSSGYPITETKHANRADRYSYNQWMNEKAWYNYKTKQMCKSCPKGQDVDDYDWSPIMGRAATIWSIETGTHLVDFHPPQWCEWLSSQFASELKKLSNWFVLIEDGYTLWDGTARAVEKMIFPEKDVK